MESLSGSKICLTLAGSKPLQDHVYSIISYLIEIVLWPQDLTMQEPFCWENSTCTNSPMDPQEKIQITGICTILGIRTITPGAQVGDLDLLRPQGNAQLLWEVTPVDL